MFGMREQRFLHFASVLYNGEVYMTPQDFLHSVTQEGARGLLFVKSRAFFFKLLCVTLEKSLEAFILFSTKE
mgnify:FL=1